MLVYKRNATYRMHSFSVPAPLPVQRFSNPQVSLISVFLPHPRITARRWSDTDQRPFSDFFHIWNQLSTFEYPPRLFEAQRPGWLSLQYIGKDPVVNCTVSIVHCRTTKTTPCSVLAPNSAKDRLPGAITIVGITAPIAPSHRRPRYVSYV